MLSIGFRNHEVLLSCPRAVEVYMGEQGYTKDDMSWWEEDEERTILEDDEE